MRQIDFLKLSYKSFMRSPNLTTKMIYKILAAIGFLFFVIYMLMFVFLAYYGIREKYPDVDVFYKANFYLFLFFFIVFYVLMYVQFNQMDVKPFMILPVSKRKIVSYHLLRVIAHPVNLVFGLMILIYDVILYIHDYKLFGIFFWSLGVLSIVYLINFLLFFSGKNQFLQAVFAVLVFVLLAKMNWVADKLSFLGEFFYGFYQNYYVAIILFLLLLFVYFIINRYLMKHFYLDDVVKSARQSQKTQLHLAWFDRFGVIGGFIKNDIRLILRNVRPRQGLIGFFAFYVIALVLFSSIGESFKQPEFNKILFLMMLSGYLVLQFGSFIPAWDSEYFPLLMSQGISYRQYLEAKWWLLAVSVLFIVLFTLPFLWFGWKIYLLIVALGIFNTGVNIPLVLFGGAFKTTPVKLNKKVKAFQNNDGFNLKLMLLGILRLLVPIFIYFIVNKYIGYRYAIGVLVLMGLLGIGFKNAILDKIALLYKRRKYITLSAFKKAEE